MAKGTSWAEATSNRENFKPLALAIVELCLALVSHAVNQSVESSIK